MAGPWSSIPTAAPAMPPIGTPPPTRPQTRLYYFMALEECTGKPTGYPDQTGQRFLRALNIDTGDIAWEIPQPGPARAKTWTGVLATAGGLMFYGQPNGGFAAVDQRNGKTLWHFPTNVRMKASPMTFIARRQAIHRRRCRPEHSLLRPVIRGAKLWRLPIGAARVSKRSPARLPMCAGHTGPRFSSALIGGPGFFSDGLIPAPGTRGASHIAARQAPEVRGHVDSGDTVPRFISRISSLSPQTPLCCKRA